MGANASITFPKSLAIQVFWLIGRILSKINCKTQICKAWTIWIFSFLSRESSAAPARGTPHP